jgi:hypothetical protein
VIGHLLHSPDRFIAQRVYLLKSGYVHISFGQETSDSVDMTVWRFDKAEQLTLHLPRVVNFESSYQEEICLSVV